MAERDRFSGHPLPADANPAHHILAKIENELPVLRFGNFERRQFLLHLDWFIALPYELP